MIPGFPGTLPSNTILGRLGSSGTVQPIPFETLATALAVEINAILNDAPAVPGDFVPGDVTYYPEDIEADSLVGRMSTTDGESEQVPFCQFGVVMFPLILKALVNS